MPSKSTNTSISSYWAPNNTGILLDFVLALFQVEESENIQQEKLIENIHIHVCIYICMSVYICFVLCACLYEFIYEFYVCALVCLLSVSLTQFVVLYISRHKSVSDMKLNKSIYMKLALPKLSPP